MKNLTRFFTMRKQKGIIIIAFLSIIFMSYFTDGSATPVNREKAAIVAENFLNKHLDLKEKSAVIFKITESLTEYDKGLPSYHIFNFGSDQGFVIVAGDDIVTPILAYSTSGSF